MPTGESRRIEYWALLCVATFWIISLPGAALAESFDSWLSPVIRAFFAPVCHQLPERSFHWFGAPFAVCSRCTGLYVGFWLGLTFIPWLPRLYNFLLGRPRIFLVFVVPTVIDLFTDNTGTSRFLTGLVAAFPVAVFALAALVELTERFRTTEMRMTS